MSNPEQHHGGAQRGNENARRSGWTSRLDPAPVADILAAADTAVGSIAPGVAKEIIAAAFAILRKAERALRFRQEHAAARIVRQSIDLARQRLRDGQAPIEMTESAPAALISDESLAADPTGRIEASPPSSTGPTSRVTHGRIAYGHRAGHGLGQWPD